MFEKVAFVGGGSIAEAMISGILVKGFLRPDQISATNKSNKARLDYLSKSYGISCNADKKEAIAGADVIILTMKPADISDAINDIKPYVQLNQLIITVLAGVSTGYIADALGLEIPVIRAMPNTSATIGYSATAISAGKYATSDHVQQVELLFSTIGTTTKVDEKDMHTITALSGSGPAYFYYTVESMEAAAAEAGLDETIAKELIIQTLVGAAEMLKSSKYTPRELRKNITSPGGTTQAGVEILEKYNYQEALIACIKRAAERSEELGSAFQIKK
ncbi:pyrroline-5-carboxylate reductase [Aquibacillus halophilus]|uniref:Pyrroline-5-carboxylate reductase n=1 Tax=Aquibacillus halophilus TaxID=930132 RepID=A0A6A8DN27_9BACI|nr:pyrroline-5-carboxylate reductase [Aquibacillus halophilus]MRH44427.1 pyrroline-5-carboxylate reductase [Aquibacillus halophilus]